MEIIPGWANVTKVEEENTMQKSILGKYYKEVKLSTIASRFVQKRLVDGLSFAQMLSIDFSQGTIHTFVPIFISKDKLQNFENTIYGWLSQSELNLLTNQRIIEEIQNPEEYLWLYPMILEYLQQDPNHYCIIEDFYAKPNETIKLDKNLVNYIIYGNDIYIILSHKSSIAEIKKAFSWIIRGNLICYFVRVNQNNIELFKKDKIIQIDSLEDLVKRVEGVILSAYDDESYIIWRKFTT